MPFLIRPCAPLALLLASACAPKDPAWRDYPVVTPTGRILEAPPEALWAGMDLLVAELTGDGEPDLLFGAWDRELWLLPGPLAEARDMDAAWRLASVAGSPDFRLAPSPRDMTGDGVADLLFTPIGAGSARLVPGPFEQVILPAEDGWALDNPTGSWGLHNHAVDLSGDGIADLLFDLELEDQPWLGPNQIWVSFGPFDGARDVMDPDASWTLQSTWLYPFDVGDLDGDGAQDMVMRGSGSDGGLLGWYGPFAGATDLEAPDFTIGWLDGEGTFVPDDVLALGDTDGDGSVDLAAVEWRRRAEGATGAGGALIFGGPHAGERTESSADALVHGLVADEYLGRAACAPGDLDGDGLDDLVLAGTEMGPIVSPEEAHYTVGGGALLAIPGPMSGDVPAEDRLVVVSGGEPWGQLTGVMAPLGDLDGDGTDELAVGLPYYGGQFWYEESETSASYGWSEVPGAVLLLGLQD